MAGVILYLLFAIAIGLIATISLAKPAINSVLDLGIENTISENIAMTYFASFCIFTIVAPGLVPVLTVKSMHDRFYEVLASSFQKV